MESLLHYIAPPSPCGYLPDQLWSLEYEVVGELSADGAQDLAVGPWLEQVVEAARAAAP